jgi:hypothetical protein
VDRLGRCRRGRVIDRIDRVENGLQVAGEFIKAYRIEGQAGRFNTGDERGAECNCVRIIKEL